MKTGKSLLLLTTAMMFSMVSCQKEETPGIQPEKELVEMTFSTLTTKTTLDASHNVLWKATDHIGVFSEGQIYDFTTQQEGAQTTFTGQIVPTGTYYAVYPYDKDATIAGEVISTEIPTAQVAVKGGFADGANVTVAKTSGSTLEFKNVCGLLQLEITRNDIASVTFEGAGGEKVAGAVNITVSDTPSWVAPSGSDAVTLSAASGTLEPGVYYLAVLPQTYNGFTLTFTNGEGQTAVKTSQASLEVKRADGLNLQVIDEGVSFASADPVYEIDLASIDFSQSFIYEAKDETGKVLAIITKEYLPASNQQAVVVYGTKQGSSSMVMDSGNPLGLVAKVLKSAPAGEYTAYTDVAASDPVHGGIYSFNSGVLNYTQAGTSAALDKVYVAYDETEKRTSVSADGETSLKAQIVPRTFVFSDRGEEKAYKLVKIGHQIWFAENLETMKYNDGTPITKAAKAKDLWSMTDAAFVNTASTSNRLVYNIAAATSDKLLPSGGWKLPTEGDLNNLIANVPQADMLTSFTKGHNITGFSITLLGRVTNNGWEKSLDPTFWSSSASSTAGKHKCLLVRMNDAQATDIPQVNAGQNDKFGFWVRLMRGLY